MGHLQRGEWGATGAFQADLTSPVRQVIEFAHIHAEFYKANKTVKTLFPSSLCVKAYDERASNRPASQNKIRGPLTRSHAVNSDSWGWFHTIWYDCDLRPHELKTTSQYCSWAVLGWNKLEGSTFHRFWNQINVGEIEIWISVLVCKSGRRSEDWSDSIQHWQKTYTLLLFWRQSEGRNVSPEVPCNLQHAHSGITVWFDTRELE